MEVERRLPMTRVLRMWLFAALVWQAAGLIAFAGADKADLTGEWEIQEEERAYTATLDRDGNGPYTWQSGRITTTSFTEDRWEGLWTQPGNDREGGFEVRLSGDHTKAEGKWWYTRVGQTIIPPREW